VDIAEPSSITAEEAVARLININYVPAGFTITQMTAAFQEMAEVEYDNARAEGRPSDQVSYLKIQAEACGARHLLAESLLDALCLEIANPKGSTVVHSSDAGLSPRLTPDSVANWAFEFCGIYMPARPQSNQENRQEKVIVQGIFWSDVTIKIYSDFKIGCNLGKNNYQKSSFQKIGLLGTRKNHPNALGTLLLGLSQNKKFPVGREADGKSKTAIAKLRKCLVQLTGIAEDPFTPFNEADGWKPRFELIDDRKNADNRAKDNAIHVSLDEARDFEHEDDDAQDWLDKNDR